MMPSRTSSDVEKDRNGLNQISLNILNVFKCASMQLQPFKSRINSLIIFLITLLIKFKNSVKILINEVHNE